MICRGRARAEEGVGAPDPTPSHGVDAVATPKKYQTVIYTVEQITNQKKHLGILITKCTGSSTCW